MPQPPAIEMTGLTVRFGDSVAVQALDLSLAAGERVALVGESGSGKTTVLRVLAGLIPDWDGAVQIGGAPVGPRRRRQDVRQVQMVFQDPYGSLHPRHMVERVLAEACAIHRLPDPQARIVATLAAVGLPAELRFRYPHQLSGGQRQRVALARALILEPRILLLDEPTAALDVSVQAEILNLLRRLAAENGLTLLLVTHNLAVAANLCERVAVMQHGRIVEHLSRADLAAGQAQQDYTRELLAAARGYVPPPGSSISAR